MTDDEMRDAAALAEAIRRAEERAADHERSGAQARVVCLIAAAATLMSAVAPAIAHEAVDNWGFGGLVVVLSALMWREARRFSSRARRAAFDLLQAKGDGYPVATGGIYRAPGHPPFAYHFEKYRAFTQGL